MLAQVPELGKARGQRHPWSALVLLVVGGLLSGANRRPAVARWGQEAPVTGARRWASRGLRGLANRRSSGCSAPWPWARSKRCWGHSCSVCVQRACTTGRLNDYHTLVVNGSLDGLVEFRLAPPRTFWVLGLPMRCTHLAVSLEQPDAFLHALGAGLPLAAR